MPAGAGGTRTWPSVQSTCRKRDETRIGNANKDGTYLANVDVGASRVDVRIVRIKGGGVDASAVRDGITRVVGDNNVRV
jgi:hypothetical protein